MPWSCEGVIDDLPESPGGESFVSEGVIVTVGGSTTFDDVMAASLPKDVLTVTVTVQGPTPGPGSPVIVAV
jgi:hypothetical protein